MSFDEDILQIIACPKCRGDLRLAGNAEGLVCEACKLLFPVENNIPVLLIEDAQAWNFNKEQADQLES
ncbi:MAG: Trm112 family protein [Desulfovibrionaceae bacterium]|nr:Trm112 family protein [Desulfovibrionaceae bacterium]